MRRVCRKEPHRVYRVGTENWDRNPLDFSESAVSEETAAAVSEHQPPEDSKVRYWEASRSTLNVRCMTSVRLEESGTGRDKVCGGTSSKR